VETGKVSELGDLLLKDALHLSERGHEVYYEAIAPAVEKMLFGE
jgi:lysophospholipase L1-like esterase